MLGTFFSFLKKQSYAKNRKKRRAKTFKQPQIFLVFEICVPPRCSNTLLRSVISHDNDARCVKVRSALYDTRQGDDNGHTQDEYWMRHFLNPRCL
jgi:hypothetical protein